MKLIELKVKLIKKLIKKLKVSFVRTTTKKKKKSFT